ncbi:hypothetical protein EVAR_49571_1 [Eumeta japonica]|uniref:Uncharacterized protein n=1 Tax=Eumeta variegata TaxID=151549 RepID=A0A4C1YPF5_EUMVA|nr:hypothetical protein EVAR_49571_1 [Eumeta japonica]
MRKQSRVENYLPNGSTHFVRSSAGLSASSMPTPMTLSIARALLWIKTRFWPRRERFRRQKTKRHFQVSRAEHRASFVRRSPQ